jgi:hypothetical protein
MNPPPMPSNCTSAYLEQITIQRFRDLNPDLPSHCRIFREPWGSSTVLCLDLAPCGEAINEVMAQSPLLGQTLLNLGLGRSLVFRQGAKLLGWQCVSTGSD